MKKLAILFALLAFPAWAQEYGGPGESVHAGQVCYINKPNNLLKNLSIISSYSAASGIQQTSPSLVLQGNGWGTTSSTSQPVSWSASVLPVQGATPTSNYLLGWNLNGGAYTTNLEIDSNASAPLKSTSNGLIYGSVVTIGATSWLSRGTEEVYSASSSRASIYDYGATGQTAPLFQGAPNSSVGSVIAINSDGGYSTSGKSVFGTYSALASTNNAFIDVAAGTSTVAPILLTSGTNNTSPQSGAIEFNGSHFYGTAGTTRYQLDTPPVTFAVNSAVQMASFNGI